MKKIITVLIILISIIHIRMYPFTADFETLTNYNKSNTNVSTIPNEQSTQYSKIENKFPQALAAGAVGIGETIAGFTLAEVLITLLIIGVVSSLVIPTVIQETQDAELKTAWKKTYADLEQATRKVKMDNAGTLKGAFNNVYNMRDSYIANLNTIKSCNYGQFYGNCWQTPDKFWNLSKTPTGWGTSAIGAVLSNGVFLGFWFDSKECGITWMTIPVCGEITIDVNGFKGPNIVGKDIFLVEVVENGIKPEGFQGDDYTNTCNSYSSGRGCSAKYLYQ